MREGAVRNAKRVVRRTGLRRSHVASVRMCCERNVMARLPGPGLGVKTKGRILCYHSVGTPEWGINDVSPERFRRQLELALDSGYRFVDAERIASGEGQEDELAITFDDGLASVLENASPMLKALGIPYTLFVVSDWADGRGPGPRGALMSWREVERAAAKGATIGSHSVSHPDFSHIGRDETAHELGESRETIRQRTGCDVRTFAIPFGQAANWSREAQAAALEAGYTTVYAQSEDRRSRGTVGRTFITRWDGDAVFRAALRGKFDRWEEWV